MDFNELYHFLFETIPGIGILVGAGIVISLICCVIFELRTRKRYRDRGTSENMDEWSLLDDIEEAIEEADAEKGESEK